MEPEYENNDFLTTQLITYIGNKRALCENIEQEVICIAQNLGKTKMRCVDLFSGSGVVARMLKRYSSSLIVNDLEQYSALINSCYLQNKCSYPAACCSELRRNIEYACSQRRYPGIITEYYAPKDDTHIQRNERVFYTHENALLIDTYRKLIDVFVTDKTLQPFFLAPLVTEASIHVNTSGVFKGFYKDKNTGIGCFGGAGKNALPRILGKIKLKEPVFSNFESDVTVYQKDAVLLAQELSAIDIAYLDPPYNQHPYGSNYFMLNVISKNKIESEISTVSGITQDWNRSSFNKPYSALQSMECVVAHIDAKYVIVSYNSEGFIGLQQMTDMLAKYGTVKTVEIPYTTFRGSRNLQNRDIHVSEYLFVLKK